VGADGNAPRALTSVPLGMVLQTTVRGNTLIKFWWRYPDSNRGLRGANAVFSQLYYTPVYKYYYAALQTYLH
jgi:hypothetical protein